METLKTLIEKEIELKEKHEIGRNKIEDFLNSKEVKEILVSAYDSSIIEIKRRNKLRKIKLKLFLENESVGYQIYVSFLGLEAFTGIFYLNENIHLHTVTVNSEKTESV